MILFRATLFLLVILCSISFGRFTAPAMAGVTIVQGDIFTSTAQALVNPVNTAGVMGKGLALKFKKAYPDNYAAYRAACKLGEVRTGKMFITEFTKDKETLYIINFPTKKHWCSKSRMVAIETGLLDLVAEVRSRSIRSIAFPALGCGLGGLDWNEVSAKIEIAFSELPDVAVVLYAPWR